ncbi:hypothetical protein ACOSQ3_000638 [Xanthoceras sorbifolium]
MRKNKELVKELSLPAQGSKELCFSTLFAQNGWEHIKACLWKQQLTYWGSHKYTLVRMINITISSLLFGALLWKKGQKIDGEQDFLNVLGAMYIFRQTMGVSNCSSVIPFIAKERNIVYRERFAGMYSSWAYSFAQVIIEIPYSFLQAVLFSTITYTAKISTGFLIPGPKIPKWWIWVYWICPTSWSLKDLLTSQYGDVKEETIVYGERQALNVFLESHYGYRYNDLPVVTIVLLAFPLFFAFAFAFAYAISKLNFQQR